MDTLKRHHFVPESYLYGFVEGDSSFLNVYSKRLDIWRRQKPKQVMVRNKYYHQDWAPDGVDKNIFEKRLGAELEPKGLGALRKLTEAPETPCDDDTANILVYLAFQRIRVPRQADLAKSLAETAITFELMKTSEGRALLQYGEVVMKDSFRFEFMRTVLGSLLPYFSRMIWELIEAEDGTSFITSDSPVSFHNVDFLPPTEPGVGLCGTRVFFPINKRFLLVMHHPEGGSGERGASEALPRDLDIVNGAVEIRKDSVWGEEQVQRQNWIMLELSQDLVVGESKSILEQAIDKKPAEHR
jgi:hypothetical protein